MANRSNLLVTVHHKLPPVQTISRFNDHQRKGERRFSPLCNPLIEG